MTVEETGRGESGNRWEEGLHNRRRGSKEERREKWSEGWMRRVWAVLTHD